MKPTALQVLQKKNRKHVTPEALSIVLDLYAGYEVRVDVDRDLCVGCDICTSVCPRRAMSVSLEDGRLVMDIDENECVLCEVCTAFCPTSAVTMSENGEPKTVLRAFGAAGETIPKVAIDAEKCPERCDLCVAVCPRGSLSVDGDKIAIDEHSCLRCSYCLEECPVGAITIPTLFDGRLTIDTGKCPDDCTSCVQLCPTEALEHDGEKVVVDDAHCVLCGACTNACLEQAVTLRRTAMHVGPGYSSAWKDGLERLTSRQGVYGRLDSGAHKRAVEVFAATQPIVAEAGE